MAQLYKCINLNVTNFHFKPHIPDTIVILPPVISTAMNLGVMLNSVWLMLVESCEVLTNIYGLVHGWGATSCVPSEEVVGMPETAWPR